jgi:hypothetical protein
MTGERKSSNTSKNRHTVQNKTKSGPQLQGTGNPQIHLKIDTQYRIKQSRDKFTGDRKSSNNLKIVPQHIRKINNSSLPYLILMYSWGSVFQSSSSSSLWHINGNITSWTIPWNTNNNLSHFLKHPTTQFQMSLSADKFVQLSTGVWMDPIQQLC